MNGNCSRCGHTHDGVCGYRVETVPGFPSTGRPCNCKGEVTEEWRQIPGYEGRYDVSNLGRIRSWLIYRGEPGPRIRRPASDPDGYLSLLLRHETKGRTGAKVHRWGTEKENAQDRIRHGRHAQVNMTDCKYGHPYDEENTRWTVEGHRACRACVRETARRARRRRASAAA